MILLYLDTSLTEYNVIYTLLQTNINDNHRCHVSVRNIFPFSLQFIVIHCLLTLSVPVVLLNSPNLSPYFSLNKFERILLVIFSSLLCLINSHFLITKCRILYVLCKEKSVLICICMLFFLQNHVLCNCCPTFCVYKFKGLHLCK